MGARGAGEISASIHLLPLTRQALTAPDVVLTMHAQLRETLSTAPITKNREMTMSKTGSFGPGFILAAAFVGPGTVVTCSAAGAEFGVALLWALLFSGFATWILQEMAMRLSLVTGRDLTGTIAGLARKKRAGQILATAVALGITTGCMAYQAGNLAGGSAGLALLTGIETPLWVLIQGGFAAVLLWTGTYRTIEKALLCMVLVMSVAFIVTAAVHPPGFLEILGGLFVPRLPDGAALTLIALIGTTVVPYNLFLHSRIAREKWGTGIVSGIAPEPVIRTGRRDLLAGVGVGIVISLSILIAAAGSVGVSVQGIASLAAPLKKSLGDLGAAVFGLGLWGAGMTSAITAPLAAAYTVTGAFEGAGVNRTSKRYRATWLVVLATGLYFAATSTNPLYLIIAAQAFNGIILPFAALVLLIALNRRALMGNHRNTPLMNFCAAAILLVVIFLAARSIIAALKF